MAKQLREYTPLSGDSPYMTNGPTQGSYAQRMYQAPTMDPPTPMQDLDRINLYHPVAHLMEAHDRIAIVQDRSCAPARGTERYHAASIHEEGRKLSGTTDKHLDIAHDGIAKHLGMQCEGVNNKHAGSYESAARERASIQHLKEEIAEIAAQVGKPQKAKPQVGSYLREQLKALDWAELADRTAPLPENIDVTLLLKEFEQLLALQYDDRFKILSYDL